MCIIFPVRYLTCHTKCVAGSLSAKQLKERNERQDDGYSESLFFNIASTKDANVVRFILYFFQYGGGFVYMFSGITNKGCGYSRPLHRPGGGGGHKACGCCTS